MTTSKLSVDWPPLPSPPSPPYKWQLQSWVSIDPPSPPLPLHLTNDNFKVGCWSTPSPPLPPHLTNDNFKVECRLTPLPSMSIWGRSTVFKQNSSHSNQTTRCASQRTYPYGKVQQTPSTPRHINSKPYRGSFLPIFLLWISPWLGPV